MCGIVGCVNGQSAVDRVADGLSRLEYRGYDSAGIAAGGDSLRVVKRAGELDALESALESEPISGTVAVGHTRWSTHGPPTDGNAHPHTGCGNSVAVVHNGIIENHRQLRTELEADGHRFESETDTEVIPHLIEAELEAKQPPEAAFRAAIERLDGSYAVACVISGEDAVFAARQDSPLVVGIGDGETYLASDVPAFREHTDQVIYLDDGEVAVLRPTDWEISAVDGTPVEKSVETVPWSPEATGKSGYEHFMLKEIHEQPRALRQCLRGRVDELGGRIEFEELSQLSPKRLHLVAAGTSYHAALYGASLFRAAGMPADAYHAHEYALSPPPGEALVVGVSQSGETADTLAATRAARSVGAETLAVTNTVGSTLARECDHVCYIRSGPEIGVAATKTFAGQQTTLALLAEWLAADTTDRETIAALRSLPSDVQAVLDNSRSEAVAESYLGSEAYFFIGRGLAYPVSLEGALKLKEISYEHAEGFPAGGLKHGPLALVTEQTPVLATVLGDGEPARKTVNNIKEVQARGAPVVVVTDGRSEADRYADHILRIPDSEERTAAVLANVQLQLFAYHTAAALGRPIDKPRNLAKSVTVE